MKINPWSFGILFLIFVVFLMINDFKTPTIFLFEETQRTKAKIIETGWSHGISGRILKTFKYQFEIDDKIYSGKHKGKPNYNRLEVGNNLLVEFAIDNPEKHKVIGFYKPKLLLD